MQSSLEIRDPKQISAMIHPLRKEILRQLGRGPATPSEVARILGVAASKVHYHVRILEKAGLVSLNEVKQIGSVKELYFVAVAEKFLIRTDTTDDDALDLIYGDFRRDMLQFIRDIKLSHVERKLNGKRDGSLLSQLMITADDDGSRQIEETITMLREQLERARINFHGAEYRLVVGLVRVHETSTEKMEGEE